ncbi:MAG TPA: TolC family protein [Gemmatimonadales bacterium]|nr:TolC family protein [Gemmatimonadales bacterium]
MVRTEHLTSAALAALVFTTTLPAQQPIKTVTLAEAIKLANETQPAVIAAQGAIVTQQAVIRADKGLFLPSLSTSAGGNRSFSQGPSRIDPSSGQLISGDRTSQSISFGATSSLTLFDGFSRARNLAAARATELADQAGLISTRAATALTVTLDFFDVLSSQELLKVDSATVVSDQAQLQVATAKLAAGAASRSDSLTALVTMLTAQQTLFQAQATLTSAEAALGHAVGVSGQVAAADDSAFYHPTAVLDSAALRKEAISSSPQVQEFTADLAASRALYAASKSSYFPTVSLGANIGYTGSAADSDYTLRQSRGLSLSLSWPIFNNFSREERVVVAQVNVENAEASLADAVRNMDASVTTQLAALASAVAQLAVAQTSVEASTENLRVVMARYQAGSAATIVDVDVAEQQLAQTQVNLVVARFTYLTSRAQLEALVGRSL